jgi:hypothetical protein
MKTFISFFLFGLCLFVQTAQAQQTLGCYAPKHVYGEHNKEFIIHKPVIVYDKYGERLYFIKEFDLFWAGRSQDGKVLRIQYVIHKLRTEQDKRVFTKDMEFMPYEFCQKTEQRSLQGD